MTKQKFLKRTLWILLICFILMNIVAYFHAYKFTHFDPTVSVRTKNPDKLSLGEKLKALFFGVNNPRPVNKSEPTRSYETISLKSNKRIECWLIKADSSKGTVILFNGFGGEKSGMLDKAEILWNNNYSTMLVDFMGTGGSEGNQTTIGFQEATEVKDVFDFVAKKGETNIILMGTSMGAAAIMKAMNDHKLKANSIILECPFGTMLRTVKARFSIMNVPSFPMAHLLVFWGGYQNNFNAFGHNPVEYAKEINCPTLLLYGLKDRDVSQNEIDSIFAHLKGMKELRTYPMSGHENYLKKYKDKWTNDVILFLEKRK